jgi:hypothetical protein
MGREKCCAVHCIVAPLPFSAIARAGSRRDYLNARFHSCLTIYSVGYSASIAPEDGTDTTSSTRSNVLAQSVVITRTMDYCGRTVGLSIILPCTLEETNSSSFQSNTKDVSDVGFLWQMDIFGEPALTLGQFRSFVPAPSSGFHLYVGAPFGVYVPVPPVDSSANCWMTFLAFNYGYTPTDRGWTWRGTCVTEEAFTDKSHCRVNGAQTLSQHPPFARRNVQAVIKRMHCGSQPTLTMAS